MLEGLDAIDWTSLEHAYGDASDVPDLLRDLGEGRESAFDSLWGNAFHQGTRYSVSPVIVPFLVEILGARRDEDDRALAITRGILEYLHGLAMGYPTDLFPRPIDPDAWEAQIAGVDPGRWRERAPGEPRASRDAWLRARDGYWATKSYLAVESVLGELLRFLSHGAPSIEVATCALLASFPRERARSLPALVTALDRSSPTQSAALVAIARLGEVTPRTREALVAEGDDEATALLRLHAAVAIAIGPEAVDEAVLGVLTTPLGALAKRESPFAGTVSALVSAALLHVPASHREVVVRALAAQHADADGLTCLQLTRDLLELVFPSRAPASAAELTPIARVALEAVATSRGWEWGNYATLLRNFALPTKKSDFAAWLGR